MNEIRRFMRFTLPGIVFSVQLLLALSVTNWDKVKGALESVNDKSAIGIVLGSFLVTGALGYILSIVYFWLYWSPPFDRFAINHKSAFLEFGDKLEIVDANGKALSLDRLAKRDFWIILTEYWYSIKKKSSSVESIDPWIDRMSDITHGLGTNLVGSVIGILVWLSLVRFGYEYHFGISVVCGVWIVFIYASARNYRTSHIAFERLINSTTRDAIYNQLDDPYLRDKIRISYVK